MARKILILDVSASMRRIIRTMILSTVNDAEVDEASSAEKAISQIEEQKHHVVLFTPESSDQTWYDYMRKSRKNAEEKKTTYVVFTSSKKQDYLNQVRQYGVEDLLEIPCTPVVVGEMITRICSPFAMRAVRRYNYPNTSGVIEQSGRSFHAEVVNFSEGGMLCDLSVPEGYDWSSTSVVNLGFSINDTMYNVTGIQSSLSRLQVVESNSDFTPKRVRLAFRFISVPQDSSETLLRVIALVEKMECFE